MELSFPWGEEQLSIHLPEQFELVCLAKPNSLPPLSNLGEKLNQVLDAPESMPSYAKLLRQAKKVLFVVDDIGRPTPAHLLMKLLLDKAGKIKKDVQKFPLLFATGVHREMTEEEMVKKIGSQNYARVFAQSHNAFDKENLVYLGNTSKGTKLFFNRKVVEADLRILIGTVEPHVQAGFGGGFKNLLPGCAGAETVGHNHYLGATPALFSMVGFEPKNNPMRRDIEEACQKIPGKTFILNTVLNHKLEVVDIVAGDPIKAHRKAIQTVKALYGVPLEQQADVILANSYPLDVNFRQAVKGIANTLFAVKEGGVLISFQHCPLGMDDVHLNPVALRIAPILKAVVRRLNSQTVHRLCQLLLKGLPPEERFFAYFAAQAYRRNDLWIFSESLSRELKGSHFPLPVYGNLAELFRALSQKYPQRNKITISAFPAGGVTYPILNKLSRGES